MNPKTQATIRRIVKLSRNDVKGPEAMGLKLMEEVGELAECINFQLGYLPHKQMKEPAMGEAADVIQNVIAIIAKLYPNHSPTEIVNALEYQLNAKTDKWESIMVKKDATPELSTLSAHCTPLDNETFGDLMTTDEFDEAKDCGMITPDDGSGYYASKELNVIDNNASVWSRTLVPEWATHVMW
jgi:NTP pyrophosphatase (non-canonical NTP hydrolase)